MQWLVAVLGLGLFSYAHAKAVFAHFMVSNAITWTVDQWQTEISIAQSAHIDAFALNMANGDNFVATVNNAFAAAHQLNFKLFFSFDYAGNGPWDKSQVTSVLEQYIGLSAYFTYQGKPFVSTFEGPDNAQDWVDIKSATGCFFMPDWSSQGAMKALQPGVADGLFSWAAWPWGNHDMDTYVDSSYRQYLGSKPYMMGVSPWFYTNLPVFSKNWAWRGDNIWFDRWQEVMFLQPELVEIITWNDYGESHYIGPLRSEVDQLFQNWSAPLNYADNMPHDGWRLFLPYLIDTYKNGIASISQEGVQAWFRMQPVAQCDSNGTSGNTALQFQVEFQPKDIFQDRIFYSALLTKAADVSVNIGGTTQKGTWSSIPDGGVGIYHGSVPMFAKGGVTVTVSRNGQTVAQMNGATIGGCQGSFANHNAWVGAASGPAFSPGISPPRPIQNQTCTNGTGAGNFAGLCQFTCGHGYCPASCYCTNMGKFNDPGKATHPPGYPANGDDNYAGLCSFACSYGYCPSSACSTTQQPKYVPTVSPFAPLACTAGTGQGNLAGLCSMACSYGFCPIKSCTCTTQGALNADLPDATTAIGAAADGLDPNLYDEICAFTCRYGYCPEGACQDYYVDDGDFPMCDNSIHFDTLDQLQAVASNYRRDCLGWYTLDTLTTMMQTAYSNYSSVNDGYDEEFGYYVTYMKNLVPTALSETIMFQGKNSASDTRGGLPDYGPGMQYFSCQLNSQNPVPCNEIPHSWISGTMHMSLSNQTGWAAELAKDGLSLDWVDYGDWHFTDTTQGDTGIISHKSFYFSGFPIENSTMAVTNPKDIVTHGLGSIPDLISDMQSAAIEVKLGQWLNGTIDDIAQAFSAPLFVLMQAVDGMAQAKALGQEEEKEEEAERERRKNLIELIITVVLLFVPVVGEGLAELSGLADIARAADLVADAGNAAQSIYGIISDPNSALVNSVGLLMGVGTFIKATRDGPGLAKVAGLRRNMAAKDVSALGKIFSDEDAKLQSILKFCPRK